MFARLALLLMILSGSAFADTIILRAADTQPVGYPTVEAVKEMGRVLDQLSNGQMRIKQYPGRQLGEERDTLEQTVFGAIDINRINLTALTNVVPETNPFTMPFIFRSQAHMRAVMDGAVGAQVLEAMEPYGLIGLAFYDSGARSFYTASRLVRTPSDMKGLRIRVQNSDIAIAMVEALGANATPMEFGQVYEGLRNGTVDGAENNWPSYAQTRHFEVAPYYSLSGHMMVPEVLVMSRQSWNRLNADQKKWVRQAAKASVTHMRVLWDARVAQAKSQLTKAGVQVADDVDVLAFQDLMQPLYQQYTQDPVLAQIVRSIGEVQE